MTFNDNKCYLMNIARTRNHLTHNYSLNNHILKTVTREMYMVITISNDLNWSTHINTITNKFNSKLGFLRRNLSRCPQKLKETAYLSLDRPTLEYAASVWDPHLIKDRNSLEAVQRKAAIFVYGDYRWRASPTHMLETLGWENLEARLRDSRLNIMYNITHNITSVSAEELGMVAADGRTKANHHFKFRAMGAVTAQLHGSFVARTIPEWNRLPVAAADAVSPTSFQSKLITLPVNFWPCGL